LKKILPSPSGEMFHTILSHKDIFVSTLEEALRLGPPWLYKSLDEGVQEGRERLLPQTHPTRVVIHQASAYFNHKSLSIASARVILDGPSAAPVVNAVNTSLRLHKEIAKASSPSFLAENIRHLSSELFQEELDRFSQNSKRMVRERLSIFLHKHSEADTLSKPLIKITIQIFIASSRAFEWEPYLDQQRNTLPVGECYSHHVAVRP